ncbi:MAG: DUF87 domain-containing protein, partial [archaeon]
FIARGRTLGSREIADEISRLSPIIDAVNARKLERAYLLGDEETRGRIMSIIDGLKATAFKDEDLRKSILLEPPSRDECAEGDLEVGHVLYGKRKLYPFMFDKSHLLTHMGVFGSSGYGKTNLIQHMTTMLAKQDVPIIIFDFSKMNYRDMIEMPEFKGRMNVYTVGREIAPFRFNPLVPPKGVSITQWSKEFAEIFDHAYWLMGGGKHVVLKALDDIYDGASKMPKIKDLRNWVYAHGDSKVSARERNWIATAERPIESLNYRDTGKIFDVDIGILPSTFLEPGSITVLELDSLSPNDRTFIIEIILQWLRDWLLLQGAREDLNAVIVLEEAHHLVNREKTAKMGTESVIDLIFREIRELGVGIIYTDQHPSMISYPALGNTSTHVYMNLGLDSKQNSDIHDASNMLGIDYDEDGQYIRKLPVGHGFMLCRRLAFSSAFLVEFPHVKVKKGNVNDEKLLDILGDKALKAAVVDARTVKTDDTQKTAAMVIDDRVDVSSLTDRQWDIIEMIGAAKAYSAAMIYKEIGCSGTVFKEQVTDLVERGFVGMKEGKVYKQKSHYYFLKSKGRRAFDVRFRSIKPVTEKMNVYPYMDFLKERGFKVSSKVNDSVCVIEKEGSAVSLYFENTTDYDKIYENVKTVGARSYVICSSDKVKNAVIQGFSRFAADCGHKNPNVVIFVISAQALLERKSFARIEFFHYDAPRDVTTELINKPPKGVAV